MPLSKYCHLMFLLIMMCGFAASAILLRSASAEDARSGTTVSRVLEKKWADEHFVLLRIEGGKQWMDKSINVPKMTYKAQVLFDNTGKLNDHHVTVTGPMAAGGLFGEDGIAELATGDAVVLRVDATKEADTLDFELGGFLPIGLDANVPIERGDVEKVLEALKLAGQYLPIKDAKSHDDALMLFKSKNYFLWALGATMLALEGTKENAALISSRTGDPDCTPEQFLWADELLSGTLKEIAGWTAEQRAVQYRFYMVKHSKGYQKM